MEEIRIQDDLYEYVNHEWLEKAEIPADRPVTGGFANLAKDVEELMLNEFKEMANKNEYPDEYLERAVKLYNVCMNLKKRNKEGMKPAYKTLAKIEKMTNISYFNRHLKELVLEGFPLPVDFGVMPDMKDTKHQILYISGPEIILPDTAYYKPEMEQQKQAILGMWANMAKAVLANTKLSSEDQEKYVEDTLKFDAIIATLVKGAEEWSEYTKAYNITPSRRISSLLKPVKFNKLMVDLFGEVPEKISVADPRFLKGFKTLFNEENFELYKHWAYVKCAIDACPVLSEQLRDIGTSYQRALMGVAVMQDPEKFAYNLASSMYSEPVGLYYGKKYFGEEAKKDVIDMVHQIIDTYKVRIKNNDFLQEETKAKAILKLDKMEIKMGYPDKVNEKYNSLVFDENASLYEIMKSLGKIKKQNGFDKLKKETDRSEWAMPGHLVNACFSPMNNDITFPAAILQAPFYSIKQTRSENLGGIGAVIGHEISHAFDNNGANCDENGNLVNWWTKEDFKQFKAKTKAMVKEFEGITLPWGEVNSSLIVSENIADNGGMAVTLNIMNGMKDANYEEYFKNWAKIWCLKGRPEYLAMLLKVDVHAPTILRANMQPRNFPEWYDTFGVKKSDKMYIAPNKRVIIW